MILLAIPAVVLSLVSLAAFFGRWSWFLDVLANFRLQFAVVLIVMAGFLALGRWFRTAVGVGTAALINVAVIVPLYIGGGSAFPPEEPLVVMSFNLLASNERFGDVVNYLREVDPDVVLLHEASRPWEVAMEGAGLDYQVTRSRSDDLIFGSLVLSRPGDPVISYGFTEGGPRAVEVVHDGIAVLGIHPLAPSTAERSALRNAQMGFAADWANGQEGPHVVTGDFNSTPWSYSFRRLLADTELLNSQRGFGLQATFPADRSFALRIPIDHLLHSPDLAVSDRRLGPPMGSDHFPLVVELWEAGSE